MMTKHNWTKKETLELIRMYESLPELWYPICDGYRDKQKKRNAIKNIAQNLNVEKAEIMRKINNLRTQFFQEYRKIYNKYEKGYPGATSSWEFYDRLKFVLVSQMNSNSTRVRNEQQLPLLAPAATAAVAAPIPFSNYEENDIEITTSEPTTVTSLQQCPSTSVSAVTSKKKRKSNKIGKRNESKFQLQQQDSGMVLRSIIKLMNNPCDENEIFGDFVASELRSIRSSEIRRKLKRVIQTAILQYSAMDDTGGNCDLNNKI